MFKEILKNVNVKSPLIHCITNYVTVNDVANVLLACGSSPIMADDINDAEDITAICNGLVINIGTLNARTVETMLNTGKKANLLSHPVVLDPVGAGASVLRTETTFRLLDNVDFAVIRGNVSEIKTVAKGQGTTKGVDADVSDSITEENLDEAVSFAKKLSARTESIIAMTGPIDIIADSQKAYLIRNGNPLMSKVSGTGCMLTAMIAAYIAANPDNILDATAAAVCIMGLTGELAYNRLQKTDSGISTYRTYIIDAINKMDWNTLKGGMKLESR